MSSSLPSPLLASFPPVFDRSTRIVILGSLPGAASLAADQYYAHPRNQFWSLMAEVIGEDLPGMGYAMRLETLLRHRIGLWDVVAEARREGSLDSKIRDHTGNDVVAVTQQLPQLRAIAFNGGTAAKIGMRHLGAHAAQYRIYTLPSSSPAYTLPFAEKLAAWSALRDVVY